MQHICNRPHAKKTGNYAKKKSIRAAEQDRPDVKAKRDVWHDDLKDVDPQRLVFLDESSINTSMTRRYGRSPRGQRVTAAVPHGAWKTLTLTAAIRIGGVSACAVFDSAMDRLCFESYIEQLLVPTLSDGDVIIMDNLSAHKSNAVIKAVEKVGARVLLLPPYSPDFNPIEKMFSKAKEGLRALSERTIPGLMNAIGTVLRTVTAKDICGWFQSCGYRYKQ
jgi:transposase